jgi:hypothetical protein
VVTNITIRVIRDHFPDGEEGWVSSWVPEFEAFHGVQRQADDRGPYVRRPILCKCGLVDQGSLATVGEGSGTGHDDGLTMSGRGAPINIEADFGIGGIVHDVVVVRQPEQDLISGDRVRDHDRARAPARLVSQSALMVAAEPDPALARRELAQPLARRNVTAKGWHDQLLEFRLSLI